MRTHTEAVGNWLEVLPLFVDAVTPAPPPGLVNKGAVCRIHESDDAMVHAHWHVRSEKSCFEFLTKFFNLWSRDACIDLFGEPRTGWRRFRYKHPDIAVAFLARIAAGINAIHFQFLVSR